MECKCKDDICSHPHEIVGRSCISGILWYLRIGRHGSSGWKGELGVERTGALVLESLVRLWYGKHVGSLSYWILEMILSCRGFPLRITCSWHLPDELRLIHLLAALSHQEISPVLVTHLQSDDGSCLTVVHQVLEADLSSTNEIISRVSVLIEDLQVERKGVVTITQLRQGDVDQAPLGVQTVPDCLRSSDLEIKLIRKFRGNFYCVKSTGTSSIGKKGQHQYNTIVINRVKAVMNINDMRQYLNQLSCLSNWK